MLLNCDHLHEEDQRPQVLLHHRQGFGRQQQVHAEETLTIGNTPG